MICYFGICKFDFNSIVVCDLVDDMVCEKVECIFVIGGCLFVFMFVGVVCDDGLFCMVVD